MFCIFNLCGDWFLLIDKHTDESGHGKILMFFVPNVGMCSCQNSAPKWLNAKSTTVISFYFILFLLICWISKTDIEINSVVVLSIFACKHVAPVSLSVIFRTFSTFNLTSTQLLGDMFCFALFAALTRATPSYVEARVGKCQSITDGKACDNKAIIKKKERMVHQIHQHLFVVRSGYKGFLTVMTMATDKKKKKCLQVGNNFPIVLL